MTSFAKMIMVIVALVVLCLMNNAQSRPVGITDVAPALPTINPQSQTSAPSNESQNTTEVTRPTDGASEDSRPTEIPDVPPSEAPTTSQPSSTADDQSDSMSFDSWQIDDLFNGQDL